MEPMEPMEPMNGKALVTPLELWNEANATLGEFVPHTTFYRWLTETCGLEHKREYSQSEALWFREWLKVYRQYPKRSPKAKTAYIEHMKELEGYE